MSSDPNDVVRLEPPGAGTNRRILVIDDNPRIHDDFRTILVRQAEGDDYLADLEAELFGEAPAPRSPEASFEVESAYQGQEGLEMVRRALAEGRPYALAFVDVRMPPGWDGVETIRHLWEVDPALQIVICTAYSDYSWEETVDLLDPVEQFLILKKPFDTVVVRQLAHSLTEKWTRARRDQARMADLEGRIDERARDLERAQALLEHEKGERRKVETLLRHAWSLDDDGGTTLREPLGDLEELLAHFRRLAEARPDRAPEDEDPALEPLFAELPQAVDRAMRGLTRIADTVRGLAGFDPAEPRASAEGTDLDREVVRVLGDTLDTWRLAVEVTCDYGGDTRVACPEHDVAAVLRELLENAVEAATRPEGKGAVRVRTHRDGDVVRLEVSDSGPGVPDALRGQVFEPWFSTRGRAGNGLAVVREVLGRAGGTVEVGQGPDGGATFTVVWPAA